MAERPIFIPGNSTARLVREIPIHFNWHSGMAAAQKKKNVAALHSAAKDLGFGDLLETSSKSNESIGQALSAFSLRISVAGKETTVECAFQSSKVFESGGPFTDLLFVSSKEARSDERLRSSGRLVGFEFDGSSYPLTPPTVFYDWLYINALQRNFPFHDELIKYSGFTDIEFNPNKSVNCQARSVAAFVALQNRGETGNALDSFSIFKSYFSS